MAKADKKNSFSFVAPSKGVEDAIAKVFSVVSHTAGAAGVTMLLVSSGEEVRVLAYSADSFASTVIQNVVELSGEGRFGFQAEDLKGILKNRNEMTFTFDGSALTFAQTKGRYNGNLVTLPVSEDQMAAIESFEAKSKSSLLLTKEDLSVLREGVDCTAVENVYEGTSLLSFITIGGGRLEVSSYDNNHFGFYRNKLASTAEAQLAVSSKAFALIYRVLGATDVAKARVEIHSNCLKVFAKEVTIVLPATGVEPDHYTLVRDYVKELSGTKASYQCKLEPATLSKVSDNLISLHKNNTYFRLLGNDKQMQVKFSSESGKASDAFRVEDGSGKANDEIDPRLLRDALRLIKAAKTANVTIHSQSTIRFDSATTLKGQLSVICTLHDTAGAGDD